jgi:osmoprotectant transport system permease protein
MNLLVHSVHWILTASNWSEVNGGEGIGAQLLYQIELSSVSLVAAAAIAVPAGLLIGHTGRGRIVAVAIADIGRAVPSFALLVLAFIVISNVSSLGFSMLPATIALVVLAIPPILVNTYVGIEGVDPRATEAARGMGLSERQLLFDLEIPLAAPMLMAGLRTAAVTVVATATLAGFAGGGGLGVFLNDGFAQAGKEQLLVGGAILTAVLAIGTEMLFALLERALTPRTSTQSSSKGGLPKRSWKSGAVAGPGAIFRAVRAH